MKIAQVCPYDYSKGGGVKSHIDCLSNELRKHGHEVKIITPGVNGTKLEKDIFYIGETTKGNMLKTQVNITGLSFQELKDLKEFLEKEKFDVIHYHEVWVLFLPLNVLHLSQSANVGTFHGTPSNTFFYKFLESSVMPIYGSLIFDYFDKVIVVSKTPISYLSKFYEGEFEIIPNGIDLSIFKPDIQPFKTYQDDKINILFLGRLERRKGVMYLIKAYHRLKDKFDGIRLIIAGDGYEKEEIEEYVEEHNLQDVELMGFIEEKDKPSVFAMCDIFCSPAIMGESFGIVLLEAMAIGKPVVAYANDGYKEVLKGDGADLLVGVEDIGELSAKLELLCKSKELREKYSKWGLEEVKQYNWPNIYEKVIKVYEEAIVLKKNNPRSTMGEMI